mgnify:CR=1 FL=1
MYVIKKLVKTKKCKGIIVIVSIIIIIGGFIISQIPMSSEKAYEKFNSKYNVMGSDYAYEWLDEIYDGKGIFKKIELDNKVNVLEMLVAKVNSDFTDATGGTIEDYKNVQVTGKKIKSGSGNYSYAYITFKNNSSKNINYIAFNIFFYDDSGNCIQSEYTNDSNVVKPGAEQTIEMMFKKDSRYKKWSVEINDITFN